MNSKHCVPCFMLIRPLISFSQPWGVRTMFSPIPQVKRLRQGKMRCFAQGQVPRWSKPPWASLENRDFSLNLNWKLENQKKPLDIHRLKNREHILSFWFWNCLKTGNYFQTWVWPSFEESVERNTRLIFQSELLHFSRQWFQSEVGGNRYEGGVI